jgi:hypothetical protein
MTMGRFWRFILMLHFSAGLLCAADRELIFGHVPSVVAQGAVMPVGRMAGTNEMRLALSLPLRNAGELTNLLASLYSPACSQYHHYLKPAEFAARFGPTPADYAAVLQFASTNGLMVTATHSNRLLVEVSGSAAAVERALHVQLHWYRHPTEDRNFFAPDTEPVVDARVPLTHIGGLDTYSRPHSNLRSLPSRIPLAPAPQDGSSPNGTFMGNDFRQAYLPGTLLTGAGQNVALCEFDAFYPDDITNYANAIGLTNLPQIIVVPVNGGVASPSGNDHEVPLDIEMILAMSPGVSNICVYEGPNSRNNVTPWEDILGQMADDDQSAQLSCSWSGGPEDPAAEVFFQQMAAQGQSFFNAVGDLGAFAGVIDFPSASPNITEVGGTDLTTDSNGDYVAESVWNDGDGAAGGGGVGLTVQIPLWQMGVDMSANGGSPFWRNLPDVALTAAGVYVIANGETITAEGTSCAAPLWAGVAALANQQAALLGQPTIGFLNPTIYALCRGTNYAAIFHDIVDGNNTNLSNATNYYAVPGFDLCTGWGTPAGTNLINALTTLDPLGLPQSFFMTSGMVGGPFPATNWLITVTNTGGSDLDWELGGVPDWLTVSPTNGTIPAGGFTNVCVQWVNPASWAADSYRAALMFTNLDLSRVQNVMVRVDIGQSIVLNGGFESGDFSDWTLVGDTIVNGIYNNIVATDADFPGLVHSGNFGALLGENGSVATLSQTVPTVLGQPYLISFWLDNQESGNGQQFSANWNGANFISLTAPPAFTWSNFQFVAVANDTNATLEFAAENDTSYFGLDDVTVIPVPPVTFAGYCPVTNGCQFTWISLAGLNYQVQFATDLALGDWVDAGDLTAVTNTLSFVDTNFFGTTAQGFYRLVLEP